MISILKSNIFNDLLILGGLFRTGSFGYGINEFLFFFIPLSCIGVVAFLFTIAVAKLKKSQSHKPHQMQKSSSNMGKDANKIAGAILILAGFYGAAEHSWLEVAGIISIVIGSITFLSGFTGVRTP